MTILDLGYNDNLAKFRVEQNLDSFEIGRVISEHKERYVVSTHEKIYDAELIGNLRFTAESRYDFPAVGDWVAFSSYDEDKALIHTIYPRSSVIERKAVGKKGQVQIIATNIDFGLIVQAVGRDFNLNRLERYLTICNASQVIPIIILSKIDLIDQTSLENIINQIKTRISNITPVLKVSERIKDGYLSLSQFFERGKTYCLLGSSGVGKSTLLNNISGKLQMHTGPINERINRGRHVTSHRELIVLDDGGIIIDNPGMREVGITDTTSGLELTFGDIIDYAKHCKFKNCTHTHENGCAILEAVENGEINQEAFDNFRKLEKEKMHFEVDIIKKRAKDKVMGKLYKRIIIQRKKDKY